LHSCADNVASRLIVTVSIHPATRFNGFLAHECPAGNLVAGATRQGTMDRIVTRAREGRTMQNQRSPARRERGQLSLRVCAKKLATARNRPPSLPMSGNGLTPHPSGCAPGCVAPRVSLAALRPTLHRLDEESAQTALALARLAETNPGHESSTLALRTAGMKDANPVATQEPLSSKPPQCRIPLRVNPRHRVPAVSPRDTRPPARFIEDNSVLCVHRLLHCHADC
jgi:hypothetical protein